MFFNSFEFLLFFPIVTLLYFVFPQKYKWCLLLAASCVFYMLYIPVYIFVIFTLISIDYIAALYIENASGSKRKLLLTISILATCMVLFTFKYMEFFMKTFCDLTGLAGMNIHPFVYKILLPLGLSYHTFQSLGYVIEVYRGNFKAEKHYGIYSLYVMFYPQLVAGPIERPYNLLVQLREKHEFDYFRLIDGLKLMAWGMFKKIVIADRLGIFVNSIYNSPEGHSGIPLIKATVFFLFQVYCDFSGYSDIAIGAARIMGIDLMRNFNRPFISRSMSEFWSRWHISLNTWFRDYVLFSLPFGKNKKILRMRISLNIFFTALLIGLWHGANWTYVIWGGLMGLYLVIEIAIEKMRSRFKRKFNLENTSNFSGILKYFQMSFIFILVCSGCIFFRANTLQDAFYIIHHIFKITSDQLNLQVLMHGHSLLGFMLILLLIIAEFLQDKFNLSTYLSERPVIVKWSIYISFIFIILILGVLDEKKFLYFQF